jgi:TolB-like protein/Flp pilus assembly protein TadD
MPTDSESDLQLEIGHVLLIDIVGYSKLLITEQRERLQALNEIVRNAAQVRASDANAMLVRVPTGDGMALVFRDTVDAPLRCAVEISQSVKTHPEIQLRMGIHSGLVSEVTDVNERTNIAGAGIDIAQRVMDCGDAGHILLSKHVAEDLAPHPRWNRYLHDLGECEVKHGGRILLVNFYTEELGNPQLPEKLDRAQREQAATATASRPSPILRRRHLLIATAAFLIAVAGIGVWIYSRQATVTPSLPPRASPTEKSIAVLPFENRSRDPDNAYFADGIQDEILTRLAKIADLKVISRTSTQGYKSKPGNLSEIAKQLGVANILEGSVQRAADQVRVNVQLVNAQTNSQLWADTYDRKLTDIFAVESEIAKGIAESLQAKLNGREEQALVAKPTNNPDAYDAYLRGLDFEARSGYSNEVLKKAIGFYEWAVQLDPNFALGWARLSRADALLYFRHGDFTAGRRDAAGRALENAQKLQPNSPETLLALGYYQYWVLGDFGLAKTTFRFVSKILPGSSEVPAALGAVTRREGNWDESVAYWEQGLTVDPRNPELLVDAAWTYGMLRQFRAARRLYDRALDIIPNDPDLMAQKAGIYWAEGNLQEAAILLLEVNAQTPSVTAFRIKVTQLRLERNLGEAVRLVQTRQAEFHFASEIEKGVNQVLLAFVQHLAGDAVTAKATAQQALNTLEPLYKDHQDNATFAAFLSLSYALLGNKDSALNEAERAIVLLRSIKDRVSGPAGEENLALIQTILGENSRAISTLAPLLEKPYNSWLYGSTPVTPALLRLDPTWDPLRGDPRFEKLLEEAKQPVALK